MSKFKVGDKFIDNGTVGMITNIREPYTDEVMFMKSTVYEWEYKKGRTPLTNLRKFAKGSERYRKALILSKLTKLLYGLKND